MSRAIRVLRLVLKQKLSELDREMAQSQSERESAHLWRVRTNVRKVLKALVGEGE
jgi:hypothetical protein